MKLFKRRAKPDSGTPAASPTEAIAGASAEEVEPGQMPDTSSADSTIQSGVEQAGDSEPLAAPAGMFGRLRDGLSRSRSQITDGLAALVLGKKQLDPALMEALEKQLIMADLGLEATYRVLELLRQRLDRKALGAEETVMSALKETLTELLAEQQKPLDIIAHQPFVILVVGVNGAGKTTTIGKLATWSCGTTGVVRIVALLLILQFVGGYAELLLLVSVQSNRVSIYGRVENTSQFAF